MRKAKVILIVISIQLLVAVSLALINPVGDYIVRTKGTEYIFLTEGVEIYGDYTTFMELQCPIKMEFDKDRNDYYDKQYAIIKTDKNGLSCISELSDNPPPKGDWLGTAKNDFHHFCWYSQKIDYNLFSKAEEIVAYSDEKMWHVSDEYEITLNVSVYKGKAVMNEIQINGVEIEEFLNTVVK